MIPLAYGLSTERNYWLYDKVKVGPLTLLKHNGKKVTLTKDDPVPDNCSWWECPQAKEGRAYYLDAETGIWHEGPDNISVEDIQLAFVKKAQLEFDNALKGLKSSYSKGEEESWDYQLSEAKTVIAGGESKFIDILAEESGETAMEIATKIKAKSDARMQEYAKLLANLRKARKEAEAKTMTALKGMSFSDLLALGL